MKLQPVVSVSVMEILKFCFLTIGGTRQKFPTATHAHKAKVSSQCAPERYRSLLSYLKKDPTSVDTVDPGLSHVSHYRLYLS